MRFAAVFLFTVVASTAAHAQVCDQTKAASYNERRTLGTLDSTPLNCDGREVGPGQLNQCGVMSLFADRSTAFAQMLASNEKYKSEGGMYTKGYLARWLSEATGEFWRNQDDPYVASMAKVCVFLNIKRTQEDKSEPTAILSDRLSLSRDVPDPQSSVNGPFHGPFVINITDDRKADKTSVGVYGTASYKVFESVGGGRLNASLSVDSAAGDKVEKSSVQLGLDYFAYIGNAESANQISLALSPKYLTDRNFNREAYQITATASLRSDSFFTPGYYICPGSDGCQYETAPWVFYWVPSLGVEAGHVVDAAGNATLQQVAKEGTYSRLVPSVKAVYEPHWLSPKISFTAAYRQRYDLTQGWDRGYGELAFLYRFTPNAYFTTMYRKGRKDTTFDPIDTIFFGIGVSQ